MEDLFKDIENHLMNDDIPSKYLNKMLKEGILSEDYPLTFLGDLVNVPQSPKHHPEGNVWNHTMMVVDEAAKRRYKSIDTRAFMWAALLHDIGKGKATALRKGRITSYNHEKFGEEMSRDFLAAFQCDKDFINKVSALVRWHMQTLFTVKDMPYGSTKDMMKETDFNEIALLSLCDRLGRGSMGREKRIKEESNIELFMKICKKNIV